jgi:hypothetical protein
VVALLAGYVALHARALARFVALLAGKFSGKFAGFLAPLARALRRSRRRFGFSANYRACRGSPFYGFQHRSHFPG